MSISRHAVGEAVAFPGQGEKPACQAKLKFGPAQGNMIFPAHVGRAGDVAVGEDDGRFGGKAQTGLGHERVLAAA